MNVSKCINVEMSIFIAQGPFYVPNIRFCTHVHARKGKDYTYLYGKHVGMGSLTPFIHKAFDPRIEE